MNLTRLLLIFGCLAFASAFGLNRSNNNRNQSSASLDMTATSATVDPGQRDAKYGENMAQYLVDLHDSQATFDFCGGMMFQLVLSDKLREYLGDVAFGKKKDEQCVVYPASKSRMHQIDVYEQTAKADNLALFHGREIRSVPWAKGGMGFIIHLSLANGDDPEGWNQGEISGYDGWAHDVGRDWRTGERHEKEGFDNFREKFGPKSFSLNHRFYLHYDFMNRLWLSAEDGCEGTPASTNPVQSLMNRVMRL